MNISQRRVSLIDGKPLTLRGLFAAFWPQLGVTWAMTLVEVAVLALIPLLIGYAIDGLLGGDFTAFWQLGGALGALIVLGTLRRLYDTRAYGIMRVELGKALASRSPNVPVSRLNARLDMGRELVDFLETEAPESMTALIRAAAAVVILATFHTTLALVAVGAFAVMLAIYGMAHRRFFRLNRALNTQTEKQVGILETHSLPRLGAHLLSLRKSEVRLSDTEGLVYGLIFTALVGLVMFNLWFATQEIDITAGKVFSIVTYSWDFVESALILPMTLQAFSRLSEITGRINQVKDEI
ncbi:ABC transporter six-transmembrane domain-containing protein [Aliiroseovarius lamellibrachiae]|uniref:ABC transporter six-transmembrane domain-containing protein n=1 Tax=Aliiroseovarius lamellibrachiae TaxID=1924933 RepID=UPI001FEAC88A|nr:ABC transporter six-transmembrane domain-containing protein [Aliiroseovarius lamellibrachiae]